MSFLRFDLYLFLFLLVLIMPVSVSAQEANYWPFFVGKREAPEKEFHQWQGLGPVLFEKEAADHDIRGIRPFFIRFDDKFRDRRSRHILYPLFNHREDPQGVRWDILTWIRGDTFAPEGKEATTRFHLFPFLFLQRSPDPEKNYFGLFPIAGEVHNLLLYDRISWLAFPFSIRLERGDVTTVGRPWPFIRFVEGAETQGFHFWPFYGQVERAGDFSRRYYLWPLGYSVQRDLHKEQPFEARGFIPFYTTSRSENAVSETFFWPFFGYTTSFSPQYDEVRYFWPLFVQRRGEHHYINRWAPIYTHSVRRGVEKQWVLWPLFRRERWIERELLHQKAQVLYFVYWSLAQSRPEQPGGTRASKRHLWPLFSWWDNGAGRRQAQILSLFEVFFPYNEIIRENWSPLFALYRYDQQPEQTRHAFLFDFITWTHGEEEARLNIGPLASYERTEKGRRFELLKGLLTVGAHTEGKRPFRLFWLPRAKP
jgi:hypothetical protein